MLEEIILREEGGKLFSHRRDDFSATATGVAGARLRSGPETGIVTAIESR
jgi:hypothetical protein